jgi:hypothetical protein
MLNNLFSYISVLIGLTGLTIIIYLILKYFIYNMRDGKLKIILKLIGELFVWNLFYSKFIDYFMIFCCYSFLGLIYPEFKDIKLINFSFVLLFNILLLLFLFHIFLMSRITTFVNDFLSK